MVRRSGSGIFRIPGCLHRASFVYRGQELDAVNLHVTRLLPGFVLRPVCLMSVSGDSCAVLFNVWISVIWMCSSTLQKALDPTRSPEAFEPYTTLKFLKPQNPKTQIRSRSYTRHCSAALFRIPALLGPRHLREDQLPERSGSQPVAHLPGPGLGFREVQDKDDQRGGSIRKVFR